MGFLSRLGSRFFRAKPPTDDFWYTMPSLPTFSGADVNEETALKYLTVLACVSLISGDVGRLPLNLYRKRKDGGKDLVMDHPLYDILHNAPNEETTSFQWRETAQGHLLLWGNHYSFIERANGTGRIRALWQIPNPSNVEVRRQGNNIIYKYRVAGKDVIRRSDQIFHLKGYGYNGLYGLSPISYAREAIGLGLAAEEFGGRYFGQGTHPSGTIEMEGFLDKDRETEIAKRMKDSYTGLGQSHGLMILQGGMKYNALTVPMHDAQFLETRDHQKTEICGMFHVPPHKIALHGANSNYSNLEQENQGYVDSCLTHWITRWEQSISLQLLTPAERKSGLFVEFLVQGLLRGDSQARGEFYNKLFQIGSMTPNEIRAKENMNPIEGGDDAFVMLNLVPLDQAGELDIPIPAEKTEPKEEKQLILDFFNEDRAKAIKESRSIRTRDRLARRFYPLIKDAAELIINREAKAVKRKLPEKRANNDDFKGFLNEFYKEFPKYIDKKMGPVLRAYLLAVIDAATDEINTDDEINLDKQVRDFINRYAERHTESSLGQLIALAEDPDAFDIITERMDQWIDTRPDKIALNESTRAGGAAFAWVVFGAGMSLKWRIRGAKTCPYCKTLDGKIVRSGEAFVQDGDSIDPPDGTGPMKIYGLKQHPPIHASCDCYVVAA